jgi:hypothetical protein
MPDKAHNGHPDTVQTIHDLAARFEYAKPESGGYRLRCPAHDDRQASLMLHTGRSGNLVLKCHAGCETTDVLAAVGLGMSALRLVPGEEATVMRLPSRLVATYAYTDAAGELLYEIHRFEPKDFRGRLPPAHDRILYNAPLIAQAKASGRVVYVVEGERDADTLTAAGHVATTNCGGAGKWLPQYTRQLAGVANVVVLGDDDEPGRRHAVKVAQELALAGIDADVALPVAGFKDVTDQFEAGHTSLTGLRGLGLAELAPGMFTVMSTVTLSPARWAWQWRMALGAISYVEGEPGVSKSTVTIDLAARWTSGRDMPDGSPNPFGGPVGVAMLTAEDSLEHTMGPRLYAAGADMAKVLAIASGPGGAPFSLGIDDHLDALRAGVKAHHVRVLVIDPLAAFLGEGVDSFKDPAVRAAMLPLSMLAAELDMAVVIVRHFRKGAGKAIEAGGGSIGFAGAARAIYQISRHPEEDGHCIFTNAKNNLARMQPSLTYRLIQDHRVQEIDPAFEIARVEWLGTSELGAQDVLDALPLTAKGRGYCELMLAAVADGVPKTWKTISEILDQAGFSARTAEAHYREMVLKPVRESGKGNAGTKWVALKGTPQASAPKPRKPKAPKTDPPVTPESVCDSCGRGPALYFPAPVSEFRCRDHVGGLL